MKQPVPINFSQGLDNKTDPWQVPIGKFQNLVNSVFNKGGLLQKRYGYGALTTLGNNQTYLTTLNGNLLAIGKTVSAYSSSLNEWITKGTLQPCSLNVLPLIRNNLNQTQVDTAISNGMVCTVFSETNSIATGVVTQYLYSVADSVTGQNIVQPTAIPVVSGGTINGSSRCYVVGSYFVIVSQVSVTGSSFLQYFSIPITNPVNVKTNAAYASAAAYLTGEAYTPISSNPGWDAAVINNASNNVLVAAYNTTVGGQGIHVCTITNQQIANSQATSTITAFTNAAYIAALVSICVDTSVVNPFFYISFWNSSTTNAYTLGITLSAGSIITAFSPTISIATTSLTNLASNAQNNSCQLLSEVSNNYSYDSTIPTHYINSVSVSNAGSVGSSFVLIRSLGLASKAFIVAGQSYFLGVYQSTYQPSYFLINASLSTASSPTIVSLLANLNAGGYNTLGLPNVSVSGSVAMLPYFYKDSVQALNTVGNTQQTTAGGIYSQVGINLVSFIIGTSSLDSAECAQNLMISGGYLGQFDGYLPVENNFFIWPDSVECTYTETSTVTPTGTFALGSTSITVSSATGIYVGMAISDTTNASYIPAGAVVTFVSGTTVTISLPTTHAGAGDTLSIHGSMQDVPTGGAQNTINYYYQAVYEWTDNQGLAYRSQPSIPTAVTTTGTTSVGTCTINVPTLRLTAKTANPVKIVLYRWSSNTQVYNQVTSIFAPLLNSTTTDSITFVDTLADANVIGNNILYTTGGVVPDTCAPATSIMTQFDTRLWLVSAENPNTLWVSKQLVNGAPIEMSNQFTIYVAPTIGTISSSGPITAIVPMDDKLIIFKKSAIYYINGSGPNNVGTTSVGCPLGNYSQPIFVTAVVGCTNNSSMVLTSDGLMFQSDKGIWLLQRDLTTTYIGSPVENYNTQTVTGVCVIPQTNYVVFNLNSNVSLMYDYYYKQWGTFVGPYAVSACIYQNLHTLLDKYGNILQETPGAYLDNQNPVLLSFTTSWIDMASLQGYERFYEFTLLANYLSPHSLLCEVSYDYTTINAHSKLITPGNYNSATPAPFGVPGPYGASDSKEEWRIHAKKQLCESFQLSVSEVFNPAYGTNPGAGFTMSGITALVGVKKATKPFPAKSAAGLN